MTGTDKSLVVDAQQGDRAALAAILTSHQRDLYANALAILQCSWDAQDAVQETACEVCARIQALRNPDRFAAWLFRILLRKCYDCLRRRGRYENQAEPRKTDACVVIGTNYDRAVLQAVGGLSEQQRLAIVLRFFFDFSYSDIEATTGWPSGTVKSRINRGLTELRNALRTRGPEYNR